MAIKDIIAEITERPFITHAPIAPQTKQVKPTKQQVLAQLDIARIMIEELFD
jgi:hypothetical protein